MKTSKTRPFMETLIGEFFPFSAKTFKRFLWSS